MFKFVFEVFEWCFSWRAALYSVCVCSCVCVRLRFCSLLQVCAWQNTRAHCVTQPVALIEPILNKSNHTHVLLEEPSLCGCPEILVMYVLLSFLYLNSFSIVMHTCTVTFTCCSLKWPLGVHVLPCTSWLWVSVCGTVQMYLYVSQHMHTPGWHWRLQRSTLCDMVCWQSIYNYHPPIPLLWAVCTGVFLLNNWTVCVSICASGHDG